MGLLKKIGLKYKKFVDYLAESNKKNYGDRKLDCCDLNKSPSKHVTINREK